MSGIAGLRGTGDWGADERPKDFRESILFFNPNGTAAIFGLTSKAGKKTVKDPEFSWWNETQNLVRLQVSGALAAGDTTVTVSSLDPTATALGRLYGTATHLKPGDVLLVEPLVDALVFNHELVQVTAVLSDTQFTVSRGAGGTTPAGVADLQYMLLMNSAFAEGTGAPPAVSRNPIKFNNLTQIFKDTYELTGTADHTVARTGDPWSNDKKRKMFDHSRAIELSILFGRKFEGIGDNGKPKRFMGGLREFIPQATPANGGRTTIFAAPVTPSSFLDAVSPMWDFDSEAGDTRIAMGGNQAILELNKVFQNATNAKMELGSVVKIYGLDMREFVLPRGRLLWYSHPLLSQHPLYKKSMFALDFSSIKYVALQGRDTKSFDDVQTKDEDVRRGFVQTECSLMVDRGGLTQAYLGNISAT
jgi:hypothetical protein